MEMGIVLFIVGLIVGLLGGYVYARSRKVSVGTDSNEALQQLKNDKIGLLKDVEHLEKRIEKSIEEFNKQRDRENQLQEDKIQLSSKLTESDTRLKNLNERLVQQQEELDKLQEKFTKEFKLVANAILKQNSEEFSKSHQKGLEEILNPLKEKIKSFEESVEKKYVDETKERSSLKQEIKQLMELNKTLNDQAENLTTALKGENKTQGNWGEMVLERILETSGLQEGEEYERQYSDVNSDNKRIQPDFVIRLPDEKNIIIDSKVSLTSYERFINEEIEVEKEKHLKDLVTSIKTHIKQLSEKNYQSGLKINSPDFVLLFIPIESSFTIAAQYDTDLFSYAWDRKVVIVSPTTLLATLRTIASVWKNEKQTRNAQQIAERAGMLYDKFVSFVKDMQQIEKGINTAQGAYMDAFNKLKTGKGNILGRIENLKTLGIKGKKDLPKELIEEKNEID